MFVYDYRRLRGGSDVKRRPPLPGNRFRFRVVRAVRAGEAKLRGRARGKSLLWLRRGRTKCFSPGERWGAVSRRCPAYVVIFSLVSRAVSRGGFPGAGRRQIEMQIDMQIEMQIYMQIDMQIDNANRKCKSTCKSKCKSKCKS